MYVFSGDRVSSADTPQLSATMLGDQAVKEKQSFKTSIRRRRKTVTFAAPTYVDYSDFDYSTDEEDLDNIFAGQPSAIQRAKENQQQQADATTTESDDDSAKVEPLKPRVNKEVKIIEPTIEPVDDEESRSSEEILLETKPESRSRNGTVRNTDSFFKDETVETKKISLTPNLLRDDNQPRPSQDSLNKDLKSRTSLDKLDKELMSDKEKRKLTKEKEKKEKEKKPSAIRSFFSRKDKKKALDDDDESFGKRSMDIVSSESRESDDRSIEEHGYADKPQRSPSKLQKQQPRPEPAGPRKNSTGAQKSPTMELAAYLAESRTNDVSNVPPASMRIVDPETQETQEIPSNQQTPKDVQRSASAAAQRNENTIKIVPRSASAGPESRQQPRSAKARVKMDLDDVPSSDEISLESEQRETPELLDDEVKKDKPSRPQLPGAFPDSYETTSTVMSEATVRPVQQDRLSESPVQVSPVNSHPPALDLDTSSQEGRSSEETPSPELVHGDETPKDSSPTRSTKEPSWDDAKLRAFFDEGDHVRDLLVVVYDKTDVEPAGKDHPVVGGLFREQNAKLAEITTVSLLIFQGLRSSTLANRLIAT